MTPRFHRLAIADVRRETPDAISIAFRVPDPLKDAYRFRHGQYLTLRTWIGGEDVRRSYSICSGVDDGELRVAIKRVDGGLFSAFAHQALRAGDAVDVMTPSGRFTAPLAPAAARTYLAIAAGSGITPVMSIIRTVLAREPLSRVVLLYGNRTSRSIIFKDALDDLKDRFVTRLAVHHVLSRERPDIPLLHGRLDDEKIRALMRTVGPAAAIDRAFLCGPTGLIDQARRTLADLGVPPRRIHVELFTPAEAAPVRPRPAATTEAPPAARAVASVRIDGVLHRLAVADGETIIEAASRAGIELPYSCKGGMCCTCRAKLVAGTVEMATNYSLEPWEIEQGFVLSCQSRPTSAAVELDYDQV